MAKLIIFVENFYKMSDHKKKYIYFDDTLEVLAPVIVVVLIGAILGFVFLG